jgi:hypothetical protein
MNDIDQITAEARNKICQHFADALGESIGVNVQQLDNMIKSAIEQAIHLLANSEVICDESGLEGFKQENDSVS